MDGIFTPISLAQVMPRDPTVTIDTGFDIWGLSVPPPSPPDDEDTPSDPDVLTEPRPLHSAQFGMPAQEPLQPQPLQPQAHQLEAQENLNVIPPVPMNQNNRSILGVLEEAQPTDENTDITPRTVWRTSIPRAPIPIQNQNVLEAQVRVPGEPNFSHFWPEGDGWPNWTDLDFDLVEPELSLYDSLFDDVTVGDGVEVVDDETERPETEADRALVRARERAQDLHTELVLDAEPLLDSSSGDTATFETFQNDRAVRHAQERAEALHVEPVHDNIVVEDNVVVVDNTANTANNDNNVQTHDKIAQGLAALRAELSRDITLSWFRKHGRTVQAPALNVEQMFGLGTGRRPCAENRVLTFFQILALFRQYMGNNSAENQNGGWTLEAREAWEQDVEDMQTESAPSILTDMNPGYSNNVNGNDNDNVNDESAMDVDDDDKTSMFVDQYDNSDMDIDQDNSTPTSSSSSFTSTFNSNSPSDSAVSFSTPPSTPSPSPSPSSPVNPIFVLKDFLDKITPDEAVVFRYFLDHPELTTSASMRQHYNLHDENWLRRNRNNNESTGHVCSYDRDDWFACCTEELLCLYAKYEQAAVNEFVAGLGPEDNQNLDDEFLLNDDDSNFEDEDMDEDREERFRRHPLSEQWQTSDTEGDRSWIQYMKPYFDQGYVPPLGEAEEAAFERAYYAARFDAARTPLRMLR